LLPVGIDGAVVLAAGDRVVPRAGLAKAVLEVLQRPSLQVGAGLDAGGMHPGGGRRADPMKFGYGQSFNERLTLRRLNRKLPIGFAMARRQLGQELVVGNRQLDRRRS